MDAYRVRPAYQQNNYLGWIARATLEAMQEKRMNQIFDKLEGDTLYMKMAWRLRAGAE